MKNPSLDQKEETPTENVVIRWLATIVATVVGAIVAITGESVIGGVFVFIATGFCTYVLAHVGYSVLASASRSIRFGVRSAVVLSRTFGLREAVAGAQALLEQRGQPVDFPIEFGPGGGWIRLQIRHGIRVVLGWLTLIGLIGLLVTSCASPESWGDAAIVVDEIFPFIVGMAIVCPLLMMFIPTPDYPAVAFAALSSAAAGQPAHIRQTLDPGPLDLGERGRIVAAVATDDDKSLRLQVPLWAGEVHITLVERDTVADEDTDVTAGTNLFDRATIMTVGDRAGAVVEAWLTPDVCAFILALISEGAKVVDGDLVLDLPVGRFDDLSCLIPLLAGLDTLVEALRQRTQHARVMEALERSGPEGRVALLDALTEIHDRGEPDEIRRSWARDGEGPTRIRAAADLPEALAPAALDAIASDRDAALGVRGLALARLPTAGPDGGKLIAERLTRIADSGSPEEVRLVLALAAECARMPPDDRTPLSQACPPAAQATGIGGAVVAHLRSVSADGRRAISSQRLEGILSPLETLASDDPRTLASWQAYGEILEASLSARTSSREVRGKREEAQKRIIQVVEALMAGQRGGLSIAQVGDVGGLALTPEEDDEASS